MISLKQINKLIVKAIPVPSSFDKRPIKGYDVCEEIYANIFITSKKKTGKTSVVFEIMKNCSDKKTIIIVFCSTIYKDENWIEIRKYFERKGYDIRVYTSIFEDGEDQLEKLIQELSQEAKEEEQEKHEEEETSEQKCNKIINKLSQLAFGDNEEEKEQKCKKSKKSKYRCCEYMIIFDDLSSELKSKSLLNLLKKNRHYKSKLIISSQWIHDLLPESRKQLDLFIIFKGFAEKKIYELYKDCDSSIPFETFYNMYQQATQRPHSFFYVDSRSDKCRSNFNQQFILEN